MTLGREAAVARYLSNRPGEYERYLAATLACVSGSAGREVHERAAKVVDDVEAAFIRMACVRFPGLEGPEAVRKFSRTREGARLYAESLD